MDFHRKCIWHIVRIGQNEPDFLFLTLHSSIMVLNTSHAAKGKQCLSAVTAKLFGDLWVLSQQFLFQSIILLSGYKNEKEKGMTYSLN